MRGETYGDNSSLSFITKRCYGFCSVYPIACASLECFSVSLFSFLLLSLYFCFSCSSFNDWGESVSWSSQAFCGCVYLRLKPYEPLEKSSMRRNEIVWLAEMNDRNGNFIEAKTIWSKESFSTWWVLYCCIASTILDWRITNDISQTLLGLAASVRGTIGERLIRRRDWTRSIGQQLRGLHFLEHLQSLWS